ncbi:MAG: flagellar M-ring protein FliF, partial [Rhizomicrobium sp.]
LGLDPSYWFKIIEAAIMCVTALLIGLFVARPLIGRMFAPNPPSQSQPTQLSGASPVAGALPAPGQATAAAPHDGPAPLRILPAQPGIDLSEIEGQVRDSSVKKIGEVVNSHPDEALAIIRTWLHPPV